MKSKNRIIQLVISDIDKTLLIPGNKTPSLKVIETVKKLENKGVIFCVATARSLWELENIAPALNLHSYSILEGGSKIYDFATKKYVWKKNIDKKAAQIILKYLEKNKLPYIFNEDNEHKDSIKQVKRWEINEIFPIDLTKDQIEETRKELSKIDSIHVVEVESFRTLDPNVSCLHITDIHGTKQYAVFELFKLLNIDRENALGIGDNENDIPLLSACGTKIAMGNAKEELKQIADYVTKPVWDDGFTLAMEKYVLGDNK